MPSAYRDHYLDNYWPEHPNNPDMWADNLELLQAYFLAAQEILKQDGMQDEVLDISTGPCLAPLMATMQCIKHVQLSDYDETNRHRIVNSDTSYWTEYAKELVRIFPQHDLTVDKLLNGLDGHRKDRAPIDVDLRRTPIFLPDIIADASIDLLTMHFVVDSICETSKECFDLLQRAQAFVKPDGWLLISALIESKGWMLGDVLEPSPNLSESQFEEFFEQHKFNIVSRTRSVRKQNQIYDGGWAVFLTKRGK